MRTVRKVPNAHGHTLVALRSFSPTQAGVRFPCAALQIQLRDDERLVAIEVWNHRKHRTLNEHASVSSLSDNDSHYVYRLPKSIDGCTELKDVVLYHRIVRARVALCAKPAVVGFWNRNSQPAKSAPTPT